MSNRFVTFSSNEINLSVRALMVGTAVVTNHTPEGWQQVQRPYRVSFPEWQGTQGYEIEIPVVLDGYASKTPVDSPIRNLERLAEVSKKFDPQRPPVLRFDAGGDVLHDKTNSPGKKWIIAGTGLEYGDYFTEKLSSIETVSTSVPPARDETNQSQRAWRQAFSGMTAGRGILSGRIDAGPIVNTPGTAYSSVVTNQLRHTRQFFVVHLWEWFEEEVVVISLHNAPYKIKRGDTLQRIAQTLYGDSNKWRDIAQKNGLRDPNHPKVGKTIKLP